MEDVDGRIGRVWMRSGRGGERKVEESMERMNQKPKSDGIGEGMSWITIALPAKPVLVRGFGSSFDPQVAG